ncbi:hypothetical protein GCM10020295_75490 [Streptomyces cinereospinus]
MRFRVTHLPGSPYRLVLLTAASAADEAELSAALFRALLTQDRIGFVVRDTDLRVLAVNEVPTMPLLPDGSLLGTVMEPADVATAEARLREVLRTGVPAVAQEQHVRSLTQPTREWSFSVSVLRLEDPGGRPTGVAVLLTDATEQWLAAQRLRLRHQAAVSVGHSLDVRQTAQELADLLVPAFGSVGAVDLSEAVLEGDEPSRILGAGNLHLRRAAVRSSGGRLAEHAAQAGRADSVLPGHARAPSGPGRTHGRRRPGRSG